MSPDFDHLTCSEFMSRLNELQLLVAINGDADGARAEAQRELAAMWAYIRARAPADDDGWRPGD